MKVEIKRFVANLAGWWQDPDSGDGVTVDTRLPISEEYASIEAQQRALDKVPTLLRRAVLPVDEMLEAAERIERGVQELQTLNAILQQVTRASLLRQSEL